MLRKLLLISLLTASMATIACKSEVDEVPEATVEEPAAQESEEAEEGAAAAEGEEKAEEKAEAKVTTVAIDTEKSKIEFVGAKVTGDHTGGFNEWEGKAMLDEEGNLAGLEFTVDTTSVYSDAEKLTGHLKSDDFFDVAKFPKASFKTTKLEPLEGEAGTHTITGEMNLRGVTKTISFPATVKVEGDSMMANTEFALQRFDFNINYKGKADDLIKDKVAMKINLTIPTKGSEG